MTEVPPFMCSCTSMRVHHESVRRFALAVDRNIPGIQIAGRIDGSRDARHDDRSRRQSGDRTDAGLNRQQIRVAAAVQRHRLDLRRRDHFAQMSGHGVDLGLDGGFGRGYGYCLRLLSDLQYGIQRERGVRVDVRFVFFCVWNPVASIVRS